jgi:hypothetical protein
MIDEGELFAFCHGVRPRVDQSRFSGPNLFGRSDKKVACCFWRNSSVGPWGRSSHVKDYRGKKLYPVKNWQAGHVVYLLENGGKPFGQTAVGFNGRVILNPANKVSFFVRTKGGDWKECAKFGIKSPGSNNPRATKFIDVTDFVQGKTAFDLKVEIHTANDTWAMVEGLQVRTLGE